MASNVVQFDTLRSIAFGSITNTFSALGSSFSHVARMVRVINNTDGDMILSTDGVNNMLFVPAGSFVLYDLSANRGYQDWYFSIQAGTQFYVKYSSMPTKNSVYLEVVYGLGE